MTDWGVNAKEWAVHLTGSCGECVFRDRARGLLKKHLKLISGRSILLIIYIYKYNYDKPYTVVVWPKQQSVDEQWSSAACVEF